MNKELQCNIVNDLLPLYMDDLTSEETNSFIKKHLEECQNCQNEYRTFKAELSNSANRNNATKCAVRAWRNSAGFCPWR